MIEKYIVKNELTLKRYRRFKKRRLAVFSVWALLFAIVLTFCAPLVTNSKPLYLKFQGVSYFPILKQYHPSDFNIQNSMSINYRKLRLSSDDSVLWPPFSWDPFESNKKVDYYPSAPSSENIFGTDDRGRDVFARLLYGFKYSISYALLVWVITYFIGTIVGAIMGYYGGKLDFISQRIVEILSTVPQFFLLIILISIFTPSLFWLVIISSVFAWIPTSYYVRAEFLKNRKREFVEAAKSMGASEPSILFKHILPNSLTPLITFTPFAIAAGISGLAALDYLGFGLEVPTPSWGELLSQAQKNYTIAPWLAIYPSICLFLTLTLLNLIGEGVRDAMDPNMN
jgi:microcin C transport system permease protein